MNGNNNYSSGISTTLGSYLVQRQTPSLKNLVCPTQMTLNGSIVDAKYASSGQINLIGNASATSTVKLISSLLVEIQPFSLIEKGSFFEIKIGGCASN